MLGNYVLDEARQPLRIDDLEAWAWAFSSMDRVVKREDVGPYSVSTVFLGIDHNFSGDGPPLLFETMVFVDGSALDEQERCATWDEAVKMHQAMVAVYAAQVRR